MLVTISSRKMVVTPRLEEVTREKLGRLEKYLDMDSADVHFAEEPNPRLADRKVVCEVTMRGHGHAVRSKVAAADAHTALDRVTDKLEQQLQKLKTKLVRRSHGGVKSAVRNGRDEAETAALEPDENIVVKTKRFVMNPMSPAEAAFQMELLGHGFFLFANSDTSQSAVVYRRDDGSVGLIEQAIDD